jgi:transcriptional regulator GlxA family with amidase domain
MTVRRIVFLTYDGFELLDLAGPSAVFSTANALSRQELYEVICAAPRDAVETSSGVVMAAHTLKTIRIRSSDTYLIMGAYAAPLRRAMADVALGRLLVRASRQAERFGSVCTGAFILAAHGLLDGRRATTHWAGCDEFERAFEGVRLEPNALYVNDGKLWTSAGVTTGVDMALAMLARDHGPTLMGKVAKQLVVYAHRPGHQSQFSEMIDVQTRRDGAFADLIAWLNERLADNISVATMAEHVGMSERTFVRRFTAAKEVTPARCLEGLRLSRARLALEAGEPVKAVASMVGFRSEAAFRTLFTSRIGVSPSHYARMNGTKENA